MAKKYRAKRPWEKPFLKALAETCNVSFSAEIAGISREHAYLWRKRHADFAKDWETAKETGVDALRLHARRRAMGYYKEPRTVAGERVDVPDFSDRVLLRLLEAHDPMFRPGQQVELSGSVSMDWDREAKDFLAELSGLGVGEGSVRERLANRLQSE